MPKSRCRACLLGCSLAVLLGIPGWAAAQQGQGGRPLSPDALQAVVALFDYDPGLPLNPVDLGTDRVPHGTREGFMIDGVRGDKVPGYLAIPEVGTAPYPVVLLMHPGAFSRDSWWDQEVYGGRPLATGLLEAGFAIVALDAQYHGGRAHNIDYRSIRQIYFEDEWFGRIRDIYFESIGDYRRAMDHLESDPRLDLTRVGATGHSTGGIMSIGLAAVDERVSVLVAAVAALSEPWLYPISPTNLAPAVTEPVLLLAGRTDQLISVEDTEALASALAGEVQLEFYDAGHELPASSVQPTIDWLVDALIDGR